MSLTTCKVVIHHREKRGGKNTIVLLQMNFMKLFKENLFLSSSLARKQARKKEEKKKRLITFGCNWNLYTTTTRNSIQFTWLAALHLGPGRMVFVWEWTWEPSQVLFCNIYIFLKCSRTIFILRLCLWFRSLERVIEGTQARPRYNKQTQHENEQ